MSDVERILEPGQWFAGFHGVPFFVPDSAIVSALEALGLTDVQIFPRERPLPALLQPHTDPNYKDAWDHWIAAKYSGPRKTVTLKHFDHVDWVVVMPKGGAQVPKAPTRSTGSIPTSTLVLLGVILYLASRR